MHVLVTGGLGNIGRYAIKELTKLNHEISVFDVDTKKTRKYYNSMIKKFKFNMFWGSITNVEDFLPAVQGVDAIIHLAAILAPVSEYNPDKAREVNVTGTKNVVNSAKQVNNEIHIVFSSSFAVYGPRMDKEPPIKVSDPFNLTDNYSHHKAEAEAHIKESGLPYTIIRFGAVLPIEVLEQADDPFVFEIPLDQRIEFIHPNDAARAVSNAADRKTYNKIFHGGGGKICQMTQRDLLVRSLKVSGIKMYPEKAFKVATKPSDYQYFDWMDTSEAQEILEYQQLTFDDYLADLKKYLGMKRYFARIFSPFILKTILKNSKYYKQNK